MSAHVSDHGMQRLDERCGLNKRAAVRMAARAHAEGLPTEATHGPLKRWLSEREASNERGAFCRIYGDHVFIFGRNAVLITVLFLPHEFRAAVAKLKARR